VAALRARAERHLRVEQEARSRLHRHDVALRRALAGLQRRVAR
jgi:hypothetical protein